MGNEENTERHPQAQSLEGQGAPGDVSGYTTVTERPEHPGDLSHEDGRAQSEAVMSAAADPKEAHETPGANPVQEQDSQQSESTDSPEAGSDSGTTTEVETPGGTTVTEETGGRHSENGSNES